MVSRAWRALGMGQYKQDSLMNDNFRFTPSLLSGRRLLCPKAFAEQLLIDLS
jgi:hypothetical protein